MESNTSDTKRALLAVILSGIVLFGWQYFFGTSQPYNESNTTKKELVSNQTQKSKVDSSNNTDSSVVLAKVENSVITLKNESSFYTVNNQLVITEAKTSNTNTNFPKIFNLNKNYIEISFLNNFIKPSFVFSKVSDNEYRIDDPVNKLSGLIKLLDNGYLNINLNASSDFKVKYVLGASENDEASMFNYTNMKVFNYLTEELNTITVGDEDSGDINARWFGIDFDYHIFSVIPENKTQFLFKTTENGAAYFKTSKASNSFNYSNIFVKKEYDFLSSLGNNLELAVDFGIWKIIALPILRGLQFFYTIFPNYGVSIIFLTIVIRMLTFPLQYKSFKSMKKMQTIQPELKAIKEKYKDDPQRQQKETMALFKSAGANPIGGCLPMILQMPIFFAFYKVLYSAVELVDAPFILWITDLSSKDQFYVLPVLMGIAMFLNTKLTPTTTVDPAQQKLMLFMPVIFGFMMKDLPAGLTLYIFISTLMGMLQQLFVYKRTA